MDSTSKPQENEDSGFDVSFQMSGRLFESTPKVDACVTPSSSSFNPKKRKVAFFDGKRRKLEEVLESYPSPQFSSTLNESITRKFNEINIQENYYFTESNEHVSKYFKNERLVKVSAVSSTPEQRVLRLDSTPKKASSYSKCSSSLIAASPMKEQHELLYPSLALKTPVKKPLTPQKFKEKVEKYFSPKKVKTEGQTAFEAVLTNEVVMEEMLKHLSDGDIFRFSMVSTTCRKAVLKSFKARQRHQEYLRKHRINKENYTITPPSSPEDFSFLGSTSPNSRNFRSFVDVGSKLNPNQSLTKCPNCAKPSVVENSVAQCQSVNCGYIYCQKCFSSAYSPSDFFDKCLSSDLITPKDSSKKPRKGLLDLSNSPMDAHFDSPVMHSTLYHSSGYFSSFDATQSPIRVKRNLSKSFRCNEQPTKALFASNRSAMMSTPKKEDSISRRRPSLVPVVPKKKIELIPESSSPPRVKQYSACSKQSKRNLKRLTK